MAELDQIDTKILRLLQENADIPNADLAGKIGLSPSACLWRITPLSSAKPGELAAAQQYCLVTGVLMLHMQYMDKHTALCDTLFEADENVVWYHAYIVTEILKSTRSSFF